MKYLIRHKGVEVARVNDDSKGEGMPNAVFIWLLRHQGNSVDYAKKYGGFTFERVEHQVITKNDVGKIEDIL